MDNKTFTEANCEIVKNSYHRLNYHIMPSIGWLNDPNGLIHFNGEYHVFFQHYPHSPEWGPMHWGHVVSPDLVHWSHKPIALSPSQTENSMCFSGSAVNDNGVLTLIYTDHNESRLPKEIQCIARSIDNGTTFKNISNNPVISTFPEEGSHDFRDPKVWKYNNSWYMILGSCKNNKGKALLYKSFDLENWNYQGVLHESDGSKGDMWECPDLFALGEKHILMTSPMNMKDSKNIFMIGAMDYDNCKFTEDSWHEIDFGDDFYAAQSFLDENGRRIIIGWMDMWGSTFPTQADGWAGSLTIPRLVELKNNKVYSMPVPELKSLRLDRLLDKSFTISPKNTGYIKELNGDSLEIKLTAKLSDYVDTFGLIIRSSIDASERTLITFDLNNNEIIIDKRKSGKGNKGINKAKYSISENKVELQIFIDKCSLELFVDNGELVMSNKIYPSSESINYDLFSTNGDVEIESFESWHLKNIW